MAPAETPGLSRKAAWASTLFYALVAFEFFYMFSPFAAYVYGVYSPGLELLSLSGLTTPLVAFFMPHVTRETTSLFLSWHEAIGVAVFLGGFAAFAFGAAQIYRAKLLRRPAVEGGLYRGIRHPQYLALMVASFGMVLIWPRYLVLFGFVTICFAYVWLARVEEGICRRAFATYGDYAARTGMFLPRRVEALLPRLPLPRARAARVAVALASYAAALALSFVIAGAVHDRAVDSLYTYETDTEVYLSLGRLEPAEIERLAAVAMADPEVRRRVEALRDPDARFLVYVMPADLFVSEIPMVLPEGKTFGHARPSDQDQRQYKVIVTKADFGGGRVRQGRGILRHAITSQPVVEAWIDRTAGGVTAVHPPPQTRLYGDNPVPVF